MDGSLEIGAPGHRYAPLNPISERLNRNSKICSDLREAAGIVHGFLEHIHGPVLNTAFSVRVNAPCNNDINNSFKFGRMDDRPIDRALGIAEEKGWSKAEFARRMAVSQANVTNWIARGMPADKEAAAAEVLGVSIYELLGRDPPASVQLQSQSQVLSMPHAASGLAIAWDSPEDLPPDAYAFVERRAVKLSAGDGRLTFEEERLPPLAFRAEFFQRKRVSSRINLVIVYADGESMEPYIQDGDVVLIDRGQVEIIDNEIYAIDYGGQLKIKRLQKRFDGGLLIKSDNAMKFPLESVDPPQAKMIKVLGRLLWRGG